MTAETIAKALGGRKAGGGWMARCPVHDDREPSLSITRRRWRQGAGALPCRLRPADGLSRRSASRGFWQRRPTRKAGSCAPRGALPPKTNRAATMPSAPKRRSSIWQSAAPARRHTGRDVSPLTRHRHADSGRAPFPRWDQTCARQVLAGDDRAGDARHRRRAAGDPSHLPCPRRRLQGAGRPAKDDARPLSWGRGATWSDHGSAIGRRGHRKRALGHAGDRTSGMGRTLDIRAAYARIAGGRWRCRCPCRWRRARGGGSARRGAALETMWAARSHRPTTARV